MLPKMNKTGAVVRETPSFHVTRAGRPKLNTSEDGEVSHECLSVPEEVVSHKNRLVSSQEFAERSIPCNQFTWVLRESGCVCGAA